MKIISVLISIFLMIQFSVHAQIISYDSSEILVPTVYDVESMTSHEIKTYNLLTQNGYDKNFTLMICNAARANANLIHSPATIINYLWSNDGSEQSTTDDVSTDASIGAVDVYIELINSTTKTIKEITLEFKFFNGSTPVYDVKTGDKYFVLKYSNLKGRPKNIIFDEYAEATIKCFHILNLENATFIKPFYNKKATNAKLDRVKIRYSDGSISNKIAVFQRFSNESSLYDDGPLRPLSLFLRSISTD